MPNIDLLSELNEPQRAAVTHVDGPILILAGAGSGKTKTLVHRLAYLIGVAGIPPASILAVTFTNQAAKEMRERVYSLLHGQSVVGQPTVGTFHAVSCKFLRESARSLDYPMNFSIFDTDDQLALIKDAFKAQGISPREVNPRNVLTLISRAKAELIQPDDFTADDDSFVSQVAAKVYPRYQALLKNNHAFDFDDLLMQQALLWERDASLRAAYQQRFRYVLVDEYQDVNRAQYVWTKLLAEKHQNICVVGDDWQSIYSWRGADFGNILRFEKDYPNAKVIKLEQNYRSTKVIIAAGNAVMREAVQKTDKTLWTANPQGELVHLVEVENEIAEAEYVIAETLKLSAATTSELAYEPESISSRFFAEVEPLRRYYGTGEELKEFAVLYRTNAQSRALEEACLKAGVPYQLIGGVRFYDRKEVKDMLSFLRLIANPADSASFRRACLAVSNGVGATMIDRLCDQAIVNSTPILTQAEAQMEAGGRGAEALKKFVGIIKELQQLLPKLTVAEVIDSALVKSGMKRELTEDIAEGEARLQNLAELKTVAMERAPGMGVISLEQFLTEITLWQDQDSFKKSTGGITLMTLHAAKGLEFSTVFMVGMEEGLFPHASSFADPRELDEERRLAYVGFTRARHKLYCLYAASRRIYGQTYPGIPSRFVTNLPDELVQGESKVLGF